MNHPRVELNLAANSIVVLQSALMQVASESLTRGDVARALRVRAVVQRIAEQSLEQWERFEAAGCGQYDRDITERAALRS